VSAIVTQSRVGRVTGCGLDRLVVGVHVPVSSRIFCTSSRPAVGLTQPAVQWVPGAVFPVVKQLGREADHSRRTNAEVKKM
jgi:hypothetical protein